jgi:low affinity Fe/Cu permease
LVAALVAPSATKVLTAFEAIASGVTLVMIFVVQHTQMRQQAAVQRKLDELLRPMPGADQRLLHVESAPQAELEALDERHEHVRTEALGDQTWGRSQAPRSGQGAFPDGDPATVVWHGFWTFCARRGSAPPTLGPGTALLE